MSLDLLRQSPSAEPARQRAREYVARGYQRLVSYEVNGGGFSWFGETPANQVLTAYGVLEFSDMAKVYPVDPGLIDRTRKWLLGKQLADGSWKPDASWLHDWSAVQGKVSTTAYITWALAQSGLRGPAVSRALSFLRGQRYKNPMNKVMSDYMDELNRQSDDAVLLLVKNGTDAAGSGPAQP